jgi:dienelactone hydrolase
MMPPARSARAARRWHGIPRTLGWLPVVLLAVTAGLLAARDRVGRAHGASGYQPRDPALVGHGLEFFPARDVTVPRAVIVFFGNDVGFWQPHRDLAAALSREGYAVVGVDIRPLFASLPDDGSSRITAACSRIGALVGATYREFAGLPAETTPGTGDQGVSPPARLPSAAGAASGRPAADGVPRVPLVLAGHSLGAELAVWAAAHAAIPGLNGVLALSPGSRSHLRISASDLFMTGEPTGPGSFAVRDELREAVRAHPRLRVAIVRGGRDQLRSADPALLAAGGAHARRFGVPFAGHSMKGLTLTGFVVRRALDWLLEP